MSEVQDTLSAGAIFRMRPAIVKRLKKLSIKKRLRWSLPSAMRLRPGVRRRARAVVRQPVGRTDALG